MNSEFTFSFSKKKIILHLFICGFSLLWCNAGDGAVAGVVIIIIVVVGVLFSVTKQTRCVQSQRLLLFALRCVPFRSDPIRCATTLWCIHYIWRSMTVHWTDNVLVRQQIVNTDTLKSIRTLTHSLTKLMLQNLNFNQRIATSTELQHRLQQQLNLSNSTINKVGFSQYYTNYQGLFLFCAR